MKNTLDYQKSYALSKPFLNIQSDLRINEIDKNHFENVKVPFILEVYEIENANGALCGDYYKQGPEVAKICITCFAPDEVSKEVKFEGSIFKNLKSNGNFIKGIIKPDFSGNSYTFHHIS